MTQQITLVPGKWYAVDASAESVFFTGDRFRITFTGNAGPAADAPNHVITPPYTLPKGVGAYIAATPVAFEGDKCNVTASVMLQSSAPSGADPITEYVP